MFFRNITWSLIFAIVTLMQGRNVEKYCYVLFLSIINPCPGRAGGGSMRTPWGFCDARRTISGIMLKFCIPLGHFFAQRLVKKNCSAGSCQVTELWRHNRYSLRPFLNKIVHTVTGRGPIDKNEAIPCDLCQYLTWHESLHCLLTFLRSTKVSDLICSHADLRDMRCV